MKYYKVVEDGYITVIGSNIVGDEITEAEYTALLDAIKNAPSAEEGFEYRLTEAGQWELFEVPVAD